MVEQPKRKHNPKWKDSTGTERQRKRRAALDAIAQAAGFDTWTRLETAVIAGNAKIIRND